MFERFTGRAQKVMALANQEAQRLNHEYIGTEHVLLGLLNEGSGVGANVLKHLGIDLRTVRREVENLVKPGPDLFTAGKLPQTPRTKKALELAIDEANTLNHKYVGTEHLLLGLLREHDGIAAFVLRGLGLELDAVRTQVLRTLEKGIDHAAPSGPTGREAFTLHLDTPLLRRIWSAAVRQSEQTGKPTSPSDLIRELLEQHFPHDQPDITNPHAS